MRGFSVASQRRLNPVLSVIMVKDVSHIHVSLLSVSHCKNAQAHANNTLADAGCPLAGSGDEKTDVWVNIYATPIANRLNSEALGMTSNLTAANVVDLISLCPMDTIAKEELSQFCNIFEPDDFINFEWGMNLEKYYGTGLVISLVSLFGRST
jgi:hypothetical protein